MEYTFKIKLLNFNQFIIKRKIKRLKIVINRIKNYLKLNCDYKIEFLLKKLNRMYRFYVLKNNRINKLINKYTL